MNGADVVAEILRREGTDFLSCLSAQPADRGLRRARHPPDLLPAGARRRRPRRRLQPHQARQEERRVRGAGRPRHRERVPRRGAGLHRERADADDPGRAAAVEAIRAADVPRRRRLPAGHQMVGAGAQRAGAARPDAARLSGDALRQGRPGDGRDARTRSSRPSSRASSTTRRCRCSAPRPIRTRSRKRRACCSPPRTRCCGPGQGIHYAEAGDRLAALAELIPAPVVTTNPGKSAIPDTHPLSLGASTRSRSKMFTEFMAKADVVMAIGSSLTKTHVRSRHAARQDHHPLHQRRERHQQGVSAPITVGGRRRRAGASTR